VTAAPSTEGIAARLAGVRGRVVRACERAGRDPAGVTLIGVTKTHPAATALAAWKAGLKDVGENRVQEAVAKIAEVRRLLGEGAGDGPAWHLVGHLQSNKVRAAVGAFAILHAVDSERLLDHIAAAATAPVPVMIEVNVSGEVTKFGTNPEALPRLIVRARSLPGIRLQGLMTVAPRVDDAELVRPCFRRLRELAREYGLEHLSMGMTEDYEVAVEEGATHVRVGRAIFGERS
jgi:pyridoxal phosphate enzyme (YggS family)